MNEMQELAQAVRTSKVKSGYSVLKTRSELASPSKPLGTWGLWSLAAGFLSFVLTMYILAVDRGEADFVTVSFVLFFAALLTFMGSSIFDRRAGATVGPAVIGVLLAFAGALLVVGDNLYRQQQQQGQQMRERQMLNNPW